MKINNLLKFVGGLFATIIVGAIGSGVWERLLSPALAYTSRSITDFLAKVSESYSDSIYTSAANLYPSVTPKDAISFIFFITYSAAFFLAIRSKRDTRIGRPMYRGMLLAFSGWTGVGYWGIFLAIIAFNSARTQTIQHIQSYSQSRMEIVRPYIGENRYLKLRSDYLRMESKNDFNKFLSELGASFQEAKIPFEKFPQ